MNNVFTYEMRTKSFITVCQAVLTAARSIENGGRQRRCDSSRLRELVSTTLLLLQVLQHSHRHMDGWMDGWLGFNGILSTQVAAISCLRKFKVC